MSALTHDLAPDASARADGASSLRRPARQGGAMKAKAAPSLELRIGSIPLRVHGMFFLMALLLGMTERDPARLAIWVAIVLVSVVIHELGHALMGMAFGLVPRIELHGMGGHTAFAAGPKLRAPIGPAKSVAISVAGPFAGFAFAVVVFGAQLAGYQPEHPLARHAVSLLFFVNVAWGIFNLVPMLPLDGGNVLRAVLEAVSKSKGEKIARGVSVAVAASIALWSIGRQHWWLLYLGVLFGFQNVQAMRQAGAARIDRALADAIERSYDAIQRREAAEVIRLLEPALAGGEGSAELRQVGLRALIFALLAERRFEDAMAIAQRERATIGPEDLARHARALRELGREADAERMGALVAAPAPIAEFRA